MTKAYIPVEQRSKALRHYYKYKDDITGRVAEYYQKRKGWALKSRISLKIEVLSHYGNGKCACVFCKEERLPCLSIDHINGNGAKERKKLASRGNGLYYWLKRNDYPSGYQTLCMNCQWMKRHNKNEVN